MAKGKGSHLTGGGSSDGNQTNQILGRLTMSQWGGPPAKSTDHLPSINDSSGSPNHKVERAAVLLRAHRSEEAAAKCVSLLAQQRERGHQKLANANEFNTDSHFDHWCRAMASMHGTAMELRDRGGVFAQLYDETSAWWGAQQWLMGMCEVATGSRRGEVWGLGGRLRTGQLRERDIVWALMRGVPPATLAGKKFWKNAESSQDIFGVLLVARLEARDEAFSTLPRVVPTAAGRYSITHYRGGHTTEHDGSLEDCKPLMLAVRYSDGAVAYDEIAKGAVEAGDLSELVEQVEVEAGADGVR